MLEQARHVTSHFDTTRLVSAKWSFGFYEHVNIFFHKHIFMNNRTKHSIVVRPTAARAISTNFICHTVVQHCCTSDLELTATCCIKLRLSLLSNSDFKLICFLLVSVNYSTYLFRQRLCSRLTALWRFANFVLLLFFCYYYFANTSSPYIDCVHNSTADEQSKI